MVHGRSVQQQRQAAAHLRVLAEEGWHQVFQENSPIVLSITDAARRAQMQGAAAGQWQDEALMHLRSSTS